MTTAAQIRSGKSNKNGYKIRPMINVDNNGTKKRARQGCKHTWDNGTLKITYQETDRTVQGMISRVQLATRRGKGIKD